MPDPVLHGVRLDLRLTDNPALAAATGRPPVALYALAAFDRTKRVSKPHSI